MPFNNSSPFRSYRSKTRLPLRATKRKGFFWSGKGIFLILLGACFLLLLHSHLKQLPQPTVSQTPESEGSKTSSPYPTVSASIPTDLDANFARQINDCVIPTAAVYGYDLYINAGFRSFAAQNALYAEGRTVDGTIITYAKGGQSLHNFGFAADLADHENGENVDYQKLGTIARWCGLEHGDRGYTDLPHLQYRGGLSLGEFEAGLRPKPLQLPCQLLQTRAEANQAVSLADLHSCFAPNFNQTPLQSIANSGPAGTYSAVNNQHQQTYTSPYGFSFTFPSAWQVDDFQLTSYPDLTNAEVVSSNRLFVCSNQAAMHDPTAGACLTITINTQSYLQTYLKTQFSTGQDWLQALSSGLPAGVKTAQFPVGKRTGLKLTGLKVVAGQYQTVYLVDPANNAAIQFDYTYPEASSLSPLDSITKSFQINRKL